MAGGVSGVFGLISLPADLVFMAWLQIILLVDVATLYKVNLKSARARRLKMALREVFAQARGHNQASVATVDLRKWISWARCSPD